MVESPAVYVIYGMELVYCTGNIISDIHSFFLFLVKTIENKIIVIVIVIIKEQEG
jgi:hypothetical protein